MILQVDNTKRPSRRLRLWYLQACGMTSQDWIGKDGGDKYPVFSQQEKTQVIDLVKF